MLVRLRRAVCGAAILCAAACAPKEEEMVPPAVEDLNLRGWASTN